MTSSDASERAEAPPSILGAREDRPGQLPKAPTGTVGLDEITRGGVPRGRATLVCGPAGCGKTHLAMEFLVRGITEYDEPGVFVAFEESADDLAANFTSLGFDLERLKADGRLVIDHVEGAREDMEDTGDWDLDGLLLRLEADIDEVGAKRVVIDTIETLFGAFANTDLLRSELHRLFGWLKSRGVTTVITGERGEGMLTRHGIEEYVSDCVIVLDHRVSAQTSTRRPRILKYRGALHGTDEYPFLIGETGISVHPITSRVARPPVSDERVSTGIARLDTMLGEGGFYRGSTILVNGTAGTGKSTLAAQFCVAACARGERAMYFAYEETDGEIVRNMRSVGIDMGRWVEAGLLEFHCFRPNLLGLEAHLFAMQKVVGGFDPHVVVMDPVSDLLRIGSGSDVSAMLNRQVDFLKGRGVTAMFTSLNADSEPARADQQLASLVDTWILLKTVEGNGEHNRVLYLLKARGMAASNQIREFLLTPRGVELLDVDVGINGVYTGTARQAQEARELSAGAARKEELDLRRLRLERRRQAVEAATAALWKDFEADSALEERALRDGLGDVEDRSDQRDAQAALRLGQPSSADPVRHPAAGS